MMAEDITKKELLSQATGSVGEKQLADQIRAEISKKGEQLSKFLALVSSFEDDIPNEAKRYAAAIKAMTAAAGLKKEDLLAAADQQIEALKEQRLELVSSMAERRSDLKIKEQKAKDTRKQIDLLTESIKRLEGEEKELLIAVAAGETEVKTVENKLDSIIKGVENDILAIKDKINEKSQVTAAPAIPESLTREMEAQAEAAISSVIEETKQPAPSEKPPVSEKKERVQKNLDEPFEEEEEEEERPSRKRSAVDDERSGTLKSPIELAEENSAGEKQKKESEQQEKKKSCPVCSNPMDWYSVDKNWKCFVCGHEENG